MLKLYSNRNGNRDFTNADSIIQIVPLSFLRAGRLRYSNGNLVSRAVEGRYWSSRRTSLTNAYLLLFYASYLNPQNNNVRGNGRSVRCLAR